MVRSRLDAASRGTVVGPAYLALRRALDSGKYDLVALGRDSKAALGGHMLNSVPANMDGSGRRWNVEAKAAPYATTTCSHPWTSRELRGLLQWSG
jgi:hypothetical protein